MKFLQICRSILLCFILFHCLKVSYGQSVHFSQFFNSPLYLNPANTGNCHEHYRVMNNTRSQAYTLTDPYTTISLGFDHHFFFREEKFSGGVYVLHDYSGVGNLTTDEIMFSAAYHREIKQHNFHAGFQFGYAMKTFSLNNLTFPEQFDMQTGYFNPALPNSEAQIGERTAYPDINAGLIWDAEIQSYRTSLGVAFFHLNKPDLTFYEQQLKSKNKFVLHGGVEKDIAEKVLISPKFLFMNQAKANQLVFGSEVKYFFNREPNHIEQFSAGIFLRDGFNRITDSFILYAGGRVRHVSVGLSYDINISDISKKGKRPTAFEISLVYYGTDFRLFEKLIDCERL